LKVKETKSFCTVVEEGGFNNAARKLNIPQPTLTRQIKLLEDFLGGKLLERSKRGVKCTDFGHYFYKRSKHLIASIDEHYNSARAYILKERHQLIIGYLPSLAQIYINPTIQKLKESNSDIILELIESYPVDLIHKIKTKEIDIAVVGAEAVSETYLKMSKKLGTYKPIIVVPYSNPHSHESAISLQEFKNDIFVQSNSDTMPGRNDWMIKVCGDFGFKPNFGPIAKNLSHLFSTIINTGAVTLLPSYAKAYTYAGISMIDLIDSKPSYDVYAITTHDEATPAVIKFLDTLEATTRSVII